MRIKPVFLSPLSKAKHFAFMKILPAEWNAKIINTNTIDDLPGGPEQTILTTGWCIFCPAGEAGFGRLISSISKMNATIRGIDDHFGCSSATEIAFELVNPTVESITVEKNVIYLYVEELYNNGLIMQLSSKMAHMPKQAEYMGSRLADVKSLLEQAQKLLRKDIETLAANRDDEDETYLGSRMSVLTDADASLSSSLRKVRKVFGQD